jgi:hypothetical protein
MLEFGAELGVGDVVDEPCDPLAVPDCHPATAGSQMGLIIGAEKQICHAVRFRRDAKKTAHGKILSEW